MSWESYAAGSDLVDFEGFCEQHLRHWIDEWAGQPVRLAEFQRRIFGEVLAFDEEGRPCWERVTLVVPRKNGKTTMLAALAVWRLVTGVGSPQVMLAASSDKQAEHLFHACATFVRQSPTLESMCRVRDHVGEIVREDGLGVIHRLSSDPKSLQGYNPSLVIADEVGEWVTPSLRRAYAALATGGGARRPQFFTITTAGDAQDRSDGILGRILDGALSKGDLEQEPGLTVCRLPRTKTLVFNYEAPTTSRMDVEALKLANPAPWITLEFLREQAESDQLSDAQVLRYHGCVWAEGVNAWIPASAWQSCFERDARIPEGASVMVGVDVALIHDSTAVAVSWVRPDGRALVEARVWAVNPAAIAHTHLAGESLDLEVIEDHLRGLSRRYDLQAVLYDPRFFERSAQMLSADGMVVAQFDQNTKAMRDAYHDWYSAVLEQRLVHAGDPVLTAHVMATSASKTDMGWKIGRIRQTRHIDAHVAAVMAHFGVTHSANFSPTRATAWSWS